MKTRLRFAQAAAAVALGTLPVAGWAAGGEVVQPLPPPGSDALAVALARLATNPQDLDALLDAGDAATLAGDAASANGFYGRAQQIAPGHPRIKLGMARSYLASRRPVEALRLFAEAEKGGVPLATMAADRALAFDLVGDNLSAQELYRLALAQGPNPELTRRLALSLAISGDRNTFEATLLPLLNKGDLAAFRTRAFGLAILGMEKDALDIAKARMPQQAEMIAPYLAYMPRLTRAQQASAANFGVFPRAAAIGTDDPDIATYARAKVAAPPPLAAASPPPPPAAGRTRRATTAPAPAPAPKPARARSGRDNAPPPPPPVATIRYSPIEQPGAADAKAPPPPPAATITYSPVERPAPPPAPAVENRASQGEELPALTGSSPASTPGVVIARTTQPPVAITPIPERVQAPPPPPPPPPPTPMIEPPAPQTLADAFADFDLAAVGPGVAAAPRGGAVDLTRIEIPREAKPAPPPPPPKATPPPPPPPKIPSRIWVQVATGKDKSALAFDWRRISRKASAELARKGPFVADWGQTNRLLAGPYPSEDAARAAVKKLKDMGLDAFTFTSATGEKVEPLK